MATARVERRLAAILAADVVGYSRLMERDEDGTLARLKAHRREFVEALIAEYQGRIVKLMGDGTLVEFASVVDAVRCAVLIQRGMAEREAGVPEDQRIRFRIGINLGDVIREADGDLYGDGVNVAARLEQLAEPGGVMVSGTAYDHLQGKLDLPLEFAGEQRVKNIERLVRAYRVRLDGTAIRFSLRQARRVGRRGMMAAAIAGVLGLVLVGAVARLLWPAPAPTRGPSIAVLPLENRSSDARLGRLADGMIENVIGDLTGLGWDVMARGTTFTYRDTERDPRRIGEELDVGYVIDGSLDGDSSRLLVNVALVDATSGRQVWTERYDRPVEDLFAVEDELAQRIATTLGGSIYRDRLASALRKRSENLEAFDLFQLAGEELDRPTPEANARAVELLRQAIELAPTDPDAHARLALAYRQQADNGWAPYDAALAHWLEAADRAVQLGPTSAWARYLLAQRYLYGNEMRRWWSEIQRLADMAHRDVRLMSELGAIDLPIGGQTARGVELVERAVRLDPARIDEYRWRQRNVYFMAGRFEEAAAAAEATGNDDYYARLWNTLIYAELGRAAELQRWRAKLLESDPDFSAEREFWRHGDFLMPEAAAERALFLGAVVKADLPTCATPEQLNREPTMRRMPECEAERAKATVTKF